MLKRFTLCGTIMTFNMVAAEQAVGKQTRERNTNFLSKSKVQDLLCLEASERCAAGRKYHECIIDSRMPRLIEGVLKAKMGYLTYFLPMQ